MVALVLGGLFLRSLGAAKNMDVGYEDPRQLLLAGTDLSVAGIDAADAPAALDRVLERTRSLPGVRAAAFSTMVPLGFGGHVLAPTRIEGYTPKADESMDVERVLVSTSYFETMGIPILRGRAIDEADRAGTMRVAVVNETLARRYWPNGGAVGRRLSPGRPEEYGWFEIVGVVGDIRHESLQAEPMGMVFYPMRPPEGAGDIGGNVSLVIRTDAPPDSLADPARKAVWAIDPNVPARIRPADVITAPVCPDATRTASRIGRVSASSRIRCIRKML